MFILVQLFTQYDICKMTVTHNDRLSVFAEDNSLAFGK